MNVLASLPLRGRVAASVTMQTPLAAWILQLGARAWLLVALLGQLLFAGYVARFYGGAALVGQPARWNQVLAKGYVAAEPGLNLVLGLHLLLAVAIIVAGAMQLLPALRRAAPGLHRWTGRLYLLAATTLALGGLVLIWLRGGAVGDIGQHLGISLNAVLLLLFAAMAWRAARARQLQIHRRWALRLFLAVSGVWFFRIGLMAWLLINQGPAGFDPDRFVGPALTALAFAQSLLPLLLLEAYLHASDSRRAWWQWSVTALLALATLLTLLGSAAAMAMMWWPHLHG